MITFPVETIIHDEVLAKDLDKTIYDTDAAFDKKANMAAAAGMATRGQIDTARTIVEKEGGSFPLNGYLRDELGVPQDELDELTRKFGENKEGDNFLYPDGETLMDAIDETSMPGFIPTKGDELEQTGKLLSVKRPTVEQPDRTLFDYPHFTTDETRKGILVARARTPEGLYLIENRVGAFAGKLIVARQVLIVEDKVKGFEGHEHGWLVRRLGAKVSKSQKGDVPAGVKVIENLDPVTEHVYRTAKARTIFR